MTDFKASRKPLNNGTAKTFALTHVVTVTNSMPQLKHCAASLMPLVGFHYRLLTTKCFSVVKRVLANCIVLLGRIQNKTPKT